MLDVAIIGGGPAGLATAISLKQVLPKRNIQVFEKARQFRTIGAGVTIAENGLRALQAIRADVYEAFVDASRPMNAVQMRDKHNKVIPNGVEMANSHRTPRAIIWHDFQRLLADCLGPEVPLHLKKSLTSLQQSEGSCKLLFKDGTQVEARLVVGADGYLSSVRQALMPEEEGPFYSGTSFWRTIADKPADWPLDGGGSCTWLEGNRLVWTRDMGNVITIAAGAGVPEEELLEDRERMLTNLDQHDWKLEKLLQRFEDFPPILMDVVRNVRPDTIHFGGVYWRNPDEPWGKGLCTLVGDSAEAMPPNLGSGTALALEGAHALAAAIQQAGGDEAVEDPARLAAALRAYETAQQRRVSPLSHLCAAANAAFYTQHSASSPWQYDRGTLIKQLLDQSFPPLGVTGGHVASGLT